MEILLTKIPTNIDKKSIQKLYVEIRDNKTTLSLPLSSEVTRKEYEKALLNFYTACNNITKVSIEAK